MPYDYLSYQDVPDLTSMEEAGKRTSLLPALGINLVSALLGGIMGGAGMAQERKWKLKMAKLLESKLKPSQPYYMTENLAGYDEALRKVIMGNIASKFGNEALARWGLT